MSFEKSSGGKLPRHPRGVGGKTAAAGGQDRDVEENHQVVIMMMAERVWFAKNYENYFSFQEPVVLQLHICNQGLDRHCIL